MARCRCRGDLECACHLQAGANVTVTGSGTANDPWIVSSTGGGGGPGNAYVAGAGLVEAPALTFNVGQGTGIIVGADSVSVDLVAFDGRYARWMNDLLDADTVTVAPKIHDSLLWDGTADWRPGVRVGEIWSTTQPAAGPAGRDSYRWIRQ